MNPSHSATLIFGLLVCSPAVGASGDVIEWRLENPHRFFADAGDFERLRPRADDDMDRWYDRQLDVVRPPWPQRTGYLEAEAEYEPGYAHPESYPVLARLRNGREDASCTWALGEVTHEAPCSEGVRFDAAQNGATLRVRFDDGQRVETRLVIADFLVVGLGDSYASGEGNPDRPTVWNTVGADVHNGPRWYNDYRLDPSRGESTADWHDDRCHRSLYSYQHLVALWLAAEDPHRAVTFLSFSCSGAEIVDGLLEPQSDPPGGDTAEDSQLDSLHEALCGQDSSRSADCREVDLMMLSIGGNDSFFAPMATRVIAPDRSYFAPLTPLYRRAFRTVTNWREPSEATDYIKEELPRAYDNVFREVREKVQFSEDARLLLTSYPNPLRREDGSKCAHGVDYREEVSRHSMFEALKHVTPIPGLITNRWQFNLTSQECGRPSCWGEIEVLENNVIRRLHRAMAAAVDRTASSDAPWALVDGFRDEALPHGICAVARSSRGDTAGELGWTQPVGSGGWTILAPDDWRPYSRRARWFRTANDTYLTQRADEASATGMLHPTAEYHAAVARSVLELLPNHNAAAAVADAED